MSDVRVRGEQPDDRDAVRAVNMRAFAQPLEADLVEALHRDQAVIVSLVAELGARVVGHILFSPVSVDGGSGRHLAGLAPMAVDPDHQRRGIGTRLVREGLQRCLETGVEAVVVVGHPDYYPRFGFVPGDSYGLRSEYDLPPGAFLAVELVPGALTGVSGLVRFHPAFAGV